MHPLELTELWLKIDNIWHLARPTPKYVTLQKNAPLGVFMEFSNSLRLSISPEEVLDCDSLYR